jgi:hypothetical protein
VTEEERRRCIITGACGAEGSQVEALAEELHVASNVLNEGRWGATPDYSREPYRKQASYLLAHYRFGDRSGGGLR